MNPDKLSHTNGCQSCSKHDENYGKWLVLTSGLFTGLGLILKWSNLSDLWSEIAFISAVLTGGWLVFPNAWRALKKRQLEINVLMTVAVIGAFFIGEHAEAAAVVFLFSLSELLESWSAQRARKAIASLLKLAPETAWVQRDGAWIEISAKEVAVGEQVRVQTGQRIPLDGIVSVGQSTVNEAPITGESMPVEKGAGSPVFAGTINGEGSLEIKTTKGAGDSLLAGIIRLVEEAQEQKAPTQRFVDRFARYYTPSVFIIALGIALIPTLVFSQPWADWTYRSLVLMVIACPCALVISTPVSVVSGLTAMARRGVLIKGGTVLEAVGSLRALAVDKTGTITEGKPRVLSVEGWNGTEETRVLALTAALDTHSPHPLAQAVVAEAKARGVTIPDSQNFQSHTGRGVSGQIEDHEYFAGNHAFAHELSVCTPELESRLQEIEEQARSVIVLGHRPHANCQGEVLGILSVGDAVRSNAAEAIKLLRQTGVENVVMLSGDNQRTASAIARQAGITKVYGDLLPSDKIEHLKKLRAQYRYIGMIGDGVNDAPALATANVGIAMGDGTDTAIETADMVLMKDDLMRVADAIKLGKRTLSIIRFNIVFSLGMKAIFFALALFGYTSLWLAVLADTGTTLLVIANALRLLHNPNSDNQTTKT